MSPDRWQQIEAVFQSATDLPENERKSFLEKACVLDPELRSEVEKLLASLDSAEGFIESPVWTDSNFLDTTARKEISDSIEPAASTNGDNFLDRQIGAFRLTRELGRGGMGAVYLAERADGEFEQKVAIKLIKRGMDSDFIIRRFRYERQILASFEHPFIARLLDGGTTQEGIPYFVMEFIQGETLYAYCDKNHLNITRRLQLFQKVCSAIEYAHEKQIIHRDIKPSNILINSLGSPKLLDFGIAKILDPNLMHESVNPTASMLRMMTPDYASPEQVRGIDVTPSSDIYSLGVLLYELLTGHRPYNFAGRALHEVTQTICEVMPELPSRIIDQPELLLPQYTSSETKYLEARATTTGELRKTLAGNLDNVLMKAMSKEPGNRYISVKDFADDVSRHLSGAAVSAPKFTVEKRERSEEITRTPESSKAIAVLPFKFLNLGSSGDTDDRFLGLGLADALITRLSKVRRFVVRPTSSILAFGDEQIDPIRAGGELKVDYILDGSIKKAGKRLRVTVQLLNVGTNAAIWATSIDETLADVLTLEDTLANKVIEVLLPQLTGSELEHFARRGTEVPEAFEHYLRGRYYFNSFTEEGLAKAFVSFHDAIAADPAYAHAYAGIADYYNWLGIIGVLPPQECFQPAIRAATKAIELDEYLSEGHASLGFSVHAGEYDWSRAEHHLKRAIELNPSNANAYVWLSIVLFTEGRFDEGLDLARKGVELDPLTPFNHHNVGWGLYFARRYAEAEKQYRKVIEEFREYSFGYYGLSKVHRKMGETGLAIRENDKANELMNNSIFSLLSEAECYAADGRVELALEKVAHLEKLSEERYVSPYQLALVYCYLAEVSLRKRINHPGSQNLATPPIQEGSFVDHDAPTLVDGSYTEKALRLLEKGVETKEAWLNWMGVEPVLDIIRNDARFQSILEKIGYRMLFTEFASGGTVAGSDPITDRGAEKVDTNTTLVIDHPANTGAAISTIPSKRNYLAYALLGVALLAAASGAYFLWPSRNTSEATPIVRPVNFQNPSLVVLPFKSDDPASQNIGVGLADALGNKLGNIKSIQVISPATGRSVAEMAPQQISEGIGVSFIVRGWLAKSSNGAVLNAEMLNAGADSVMWSETFSAPDNDLFGLQAKVAEKVWTTLGIEPLPLERQQIGRGSTKSFAAYESYLIGRYQMTSRSADSLRKAIISFAAAVETDSEFALAYVGLADAYALLNLYDFDPPENAYRKAKYNASRALEIDESLAEAHASLAYIKFYHERDRAAAELEFRRAIQVNPSYAQAHHWFALVLAAMDDPIEAISEARIAERLDPQSASVKAASAMTYLYNDQYAEAIAECDEALDIDDGFLPALRVKRWTYIAMKDYTAARAVFAKEYEYGGGNPNEPGWKIVELQLTPPADVSEDDLKLLDEAVASLSTQSYDLSFAYEIALAYNALGQPEKALDWLEKAESAGVHTFNFLEVDQRFDNLRRETRFAKLLGKLKDPATR